MVNKRDRWILLAGILVLSFLSFLTGRLHGQEPAKPPSIEQLQAEVKAKDAKIADLAAKLAEAQARAQLGWGYFNVCVEQAVATQKQSPSQR